MRALHNNSWASCYINRKVLKKRVSYKEDILRSRNQPIVILVCDNCTAAEYQPVQSSIFKYAAPFITPEPTELFLGATEWVAYTVAIAVVTKWAIEIASWWLELELANLLRRTTQTPSLSWPDITSVTTSGQQQYACKNTTVFLTDDARMSRD